MSRIAKKPLSIPDAVTVSLKPESLHAKGPMGEASLTIPSFVHIVQEGNGLLVSVANPKGKEQRTMWGTTASLVKNMLQGVKEGYQKQLEIMGTGFKAALSGSTLTLNIGFSHPIIYTVPKGISASVEKTVITLKGIDKQLVGEVAAQLYRMKKPDPYKGVGIRFVGQVIKLKPGKQAKTAGAA